jgi:hypothetical protein
MGGQGCSSTVDTSSSASSTSRRSPRLRHHIDHGPLSDTSSFFADLMPHVRFASCSCRPGSCHVDAWGCPPLPLPPPCPMGSSLPPLAGLSSCPLGVSGLSSVSRFIRCPGAFSGANWGVRLWRGPSKTCPPGVRSSSLNSRSSFRQISPGFLSPLRRPSGAAGRGPRSPYGGFLFVR